MLSANQGGDLLTPTYPRDQLSVQCVQFKHIISTIRGSSLPARYARLRDSGSARNLRLRQLRNVAKRDDQFSGGTHASIVYDYQ